VVYDPINGEFLATDKTVRTLSQQFAVDTDSGRVPRTCEKLTTKFFVYRTATQGGVHPDTL